ncbi:hypothetical protein Kpol_1036p20 [Vanderwaltozyma polyspora DSM 70294]|uniref:Small ribosomal subunit protein uS9m n=1 Tax=Vanderwaltozyma polyspora (strain ATCC 22028 / DSM 70294 / BCRC 21397 / CBS 2163 / NBRC 10782 / NRRL Y-8283 / UCD 57-17) TaxID=436907 RepID=A7TEH1_VANPO|nr:uncharacterized protein Kpol_1036p20 [Vanderwaltozyma polyspora DSM 70294]EDO19278.1 hypothetical protein Kpol_1036p20 [Vanderwaltozyma polyspora DSM 70294]
MRAYTLAAMRGGLNWKPFASLSLKRNFSKSFMNLQMNNNGNNNFELTRIVPKLTTFYSANPHHEDCMNQLEALHRKYIKYPTLSQSQEGLEKPSWISFDDYSLFGGGTRLRPIQYQNLVTALNRLYSIDPQLSNDEIKNELSKYQKKVNLNASLSDLKSLDEFGRAVAVGKRKSSSSKVYLVRGDGDIIVNGRPFNDYFVKLKDRLSIMYPLQVIDSVGSYNMFVTTSGGGSTGQAEATMHAIAKALLIFNPLLKPRLRKAGLMTRDYRHVERKKPGKKKARKMPAWVKR